MARLPDIPVDLWRSFQNTIFGEKADDIQSAESFRWGVDDALGQLPPDDGQDWQAEAKRLEEEQQRRQEEQRKQIEEQARKDQEDYQRIEEERAVAARANELARNAPQSTYNDPTAGGTQSQPLSFADTANGMIAKAFGQGTTAPDEDPSGMAAWTQPSPPFDPRHFVPTPNIEPLGPAMRGVTVEPSYLRPETRNRAVPGDVNEYSESGAVPTSEGVYPGSGVFRNAPVQSAEEDWQEGPQSAMSPERDWYGGQPTNPGQGYEGRALPGTSDPAEYPWSSGGEGRDPATPGVVNQGLSFADTANNLMQQAFGPAPGTEKPIQNPDGSITTERSITVTDPDLNDGRATNIPTVWGGQIVSDDEAVDNAIKSGRSWPSFASIDEAEAAARQRSADLGAGRERSIGGTSLPYDAREADQGPHELPRPEPGLLERAGQAVSGAYNTAVRGGMPDVVDVGRRALESAQEPAISEAAQAGVEAGRKAYEDPMTSAMPGLPRGLAVYNAAQGAASDVIGRRVGERLGTTDETIANLPIIGPVSSTDVAGVVGQTLLDPTNLVSAEPAARAAAPTVRRAGEALAREGAEQLMGLTPMPRMVQSSGGGMSRDAIDAIKALRATGMDDAAANAERELAMKTPMTLEEIQRQTRAALPEPPAAGPQPGDNIRLPDGTRARVEDAPASVAPESPQREPIAYAASRQGIDALYHETDPRTALLWPQEVSGTSLKGLNVSPDPSLALGQAGKGAVVEFVGTDQISVRAMRRKPGAGLLEATGQQLPEWEIMAVNPPPAELIQSITLKPDAKLDRLSRQVAKRLTERQGWTREVLPDGSVKLTNPEVGASRATEVPRPAPLAETVYEPPTGPQPGDRVRLPDGTRAAVIEGGGGAPPTGRPPAPPSGGPPLPPEGGSPGPLAETVYEPPRTTAGGGRGAPPSAPPPAPPSGPLPPPPLGANPALVAQEAQRGAARGAMLNRRVQAPDSAVPARVQAAAKTTDPLAAVRWAEDMLTDMAGGKPLPENDPRRASTLARVNASGIANHRVETELEPVVLDAAHAGLQHELPQYLEDLQQRDILHEFFRRGYQDAIAAGKSVAEATAAGEAKLRARQGASTDMTYELIDARLKGQEQRLQSNGKWDALQSLAQDVWDSNQRNLDRAHAAGEIADDTHALLTQRYPHYVPTVPISHLDPGGVGRGIGGSANKVTRGTTPLVKSLEDVGTSGERLNPIVATRGAIIRTERAAARNEIANRFAQMYDDAVATGGLKPPTETATRQLWNGTEPVHFFSNGEPQTIHVPKPIADGIEASSAAGMDEFSNLYKRLVRGVTQNITGKRGGFIFTNLARDTGDYMVRRMAEEGGPHHLPGAMLTWADEAGRAFMDIARANANVRGVVGAGAGAVAGSAGDDANTPLDVRLRHAGEGAVVGMFLGGANRVRSTGRAAQYVERGGGMGGIQSNWKANQNWYQAVLRDGGAPIRNVGDFGNFLKQWGKEIATFQGVGGINERAELIGRTASMRRAERGGAGPLESMIAGRNASIDFDRYGTLVRAVNGYIPFFGATTQGGAQFARLFRDHPVAATGSILATLGPPLLLTEAWNRSDPARAKAYDDVPQYLKDSGLVVMAPWAGSDQRGSRPMYVWIPGQIVAPFIIAGREAMRDLPGLEPSAGRADVDSEAGDAERWARVFGTIAGTFSPIKGESAGAAASSMMPPGVKQVAELATNQDLFRGGAIASDFNDQRASAFGRAVSGGINELGRQTGATPLQNVRPSHVDYVARQLPAYGDIITGASDLAAPGRYKDSEDRPIANEPGVGGVVGRFVRDTGGANLERAQAAAWTPALDSAVRSAGLRPSAITPTVPSTYQDAPLTRDEQVRWQLAFNRELRQSLASARTSSDWLRPATREQAIRDAISEARSTAADRALRLSSYDIQQRAARAARMQQGSR